MEERRKVRVQTRDGREDGAQMSYGLMIETNFDNCFEIVCRGRGRESDCRGLQSSFRGHESDYRGR